MRRYNFDRLFGDVFRRAGIQLGELLRKSQLPEDLFGRKNILLTREEYFRLVETLGTMEAEHPNLAEDIAVDGRIETLSPPVFAAYCSDCGDTFLRRLAHYKKLVGPVKLSFSETEETLTVSVSSDDASEPLPYFFARLELLFIEGVLRRATRADISLISSSKTSITLRREDLRRPFLSRNDSMWQHLEPELRRRLSEMDVDDTMSIRVRSCLVELLPAGKTTIDDIASKLCMSKRTLQRRLTEEGTNFQKVLNETRLRLTRNFLLHSNRTSEDIAFLLGYEDTTAFLRAFSTWTGQSLSAYKKSLK